MASLPPLDSENAQLPIVKPPIVDEDSQDSNSNLVGGDSTQPHTSRNFVVTPPQTESAQILLSLSCPFNQQQQLQPDLTSLQQTVNGHIIPETVFTEQTFVVASDETSDTSSNPINEHAGESETSVRYNGETQDQEVSSRSLLATLLRRNPASQTQSNVAYYDNYKNLYGGESSSSSEGSKNQNEVDTSKANNFALQPEAILEYPFLIQTKEGGLVDAVDMLNVFDHGEVFDGKPTDKMPKESVVDDTTSQPVIENHELEHIKQNTEEELKNDPEAVVLYKTNELGQVEQYVLSSSDIFALKAMNEEMKRQKPQNFDHGGSPHIEVEFPATGGNTSLITRIFSNDDKVAKAISKLPFKKTSSNRNTKVESVNTNSSSSTSGDRMLDDTSLTVDPHQHENMFEELDNQFSMDCSMENIQREYGAYEEASKQESQFQFEHNYFANALKDGDEECPVGISEDNYDLGSVMLIQQPSEGLTLVALSNDNNNSSSSDNNNIKRKSNANVAPSSPSLDNSFPIFGTVGGDVYLNGGERAPRRNGVIDIRKPMFNGKCDLIINNDGLMNPVLTPTVINHRAVAATTTTSSIARGFLELTSGAKSLRNGKTKRRNSVNDAVADGTLTLPFKKVKNAVNRNGIAAAEKKPRRTYRRRSTSLNEDSIGARSENHSLNGGYHSGSGDASLVEEIIVDEVLS